MEAVHYERYYEGDCAGGVHFEVAERAWVEEWVYGEWVEWLYVGV